MNKSKITITTKRFSAPRDDANNFEAITVAHFTLAEFRGCHRLTVVFDHDTAWEEIPGAKELFEGTRNVRRHWLAIRDDNSRRHFR